MNRKRYGIVAIAVCLVIAGLLFRSRSNGSNVDAAVLALRQAGVIVSPLTPVPLTGIVNRNRIYLTPQLPCGLTYYSVSIPPGQNTEANLKLVINLAKCDALTNIAFCSDSVTALRRSSIEELFRLSKCSAPLKQDLSILMPDVEIGVFPAPTNPAPHSPTPGAPTPKSSEQDRDRTN